MRAQLLRSTIEQVFSARSYVDPEANRRTLALARARLAGKRLWDLTESNPTRAQIPYEERQIAGALANARALCYEPEPFGHESARAAVAGLYARRALDVSVSRVMLTASTSEAYSFLFKLLCDPGDEILVPRPSYPLFEQLANLSDVRLAGYRLAYDGAWHIDFESLAAACSERSRAILVVSPNNPTGSFLKRTELGRLQELGLPIVCDEVFSSYPLRADPSRAESVLEASSGLVFSLGGLSKFAALPQMKLAWIIAGGPEPLVSEALLRLSHIADAFLSVNTPVQVALPGLLAATEPVRAAIRARLVGNLAVLDRTLEGCAATRLHLEGGWYAVLRLPAHRSEEDWVLGLIEEAEVVVEPGYFYDFEQEPFVVLSLLTAEGVFEEGVARLAAYVEDSLL